MTITKYYRKATMLEKTKKLKKKPEIYVTYLDNTETHRFTCFNKHNDLFRMIKFLEINNRYYVHEMILNGQKRKPYLDLEKTFPDEKTMKKNFVNIIKKLRSDIITVFKSEYNEIIKAEDILLLDSSGKVEDGYKLSLHIIVSPYNKTYYYTNSKYTSSSAFHFFTSLINLDPNYEEYLDEQVYSTDVNFRIIGSYKTFKDNRCLRPIDSKTFNVIELNQIMDDVDESSESTNDSNQESDGNSESSDDSSENSDNSNDKSDEKSDDKSDEKSDDKSEKSDDKSDNDSYDKDSDDKPDDEKSDNKSDSESSDEESDTEITFQELEYLLTYIKPDCKKLTTPIAEQTTKAKKLFTKNDNAPVKTDISKYLLKCIQKHHPTAKLCGLYKDIYYNFTYKNKKEPCPISGETHKSNHFYVFETERGYYLKCFSKGCKGKSKHIGYADPVDDFIDNSHQINQQYLIMGNKIADNDEPVCKFIQEWLESDKIKTLAVKSAMGTGKTTMVEKILQYDKSIKKILWITHRQSLSKQIYGKFKKTKFKNYMDVKGSLKEYDRVIVQIDSIERIQQFDGDAPTFNVYDLIIIDEVEGNLNHYNSPFLNKSGKCARNIFKFMTECVDCAKKLLVIDADLGMRSKLFIDRMGESLIINNNYKPMKKFFTLTNNERMFQKNIFNDIDNDLNVCIVSMSAGALEKLEAILKKDKINYVMHTSRTDDKLKNELEDVGNFWVNYQAVLYSPTIECGVDFNEEHFDKIYCVLKNGQMTCSQRSFLQMVGRIRQIKDPNILCYYDGPNKLNASVYTYDGVLSYFRYYESINNKKIIEDVEYEKQIIGGEVKLVRTKKDISLFDHISVYNEVEQLNKHPKIFLTILNKLIQRAGHELIIKMGSKAKREKNKSKKLVDKLAEIDETKYDLQKLLDKQSKNKLDVKEKLALKKIFFNKIFGIKYTKGNEEDFKNFYEEFANKESVFRRIEIMDGHKVIYDGYDFDNFNEGKNKAAFVIVFDMINRLLEQNKKKYVSNDLIDIIIDNDQYVRAIKDIAKDSIYFKNEEKNRALFFKSKGKFKLPDEKNQIYYTRVIQSLLDRYGIILVANGQKRINGTRKYTYLLSVDKQIKNIIDFKYGNTNKINIYKKIFMEIKK
jgi:hypothetical protein